MASDLSLWKRPRARLNSAVQPRALVAAGARFAPVPRPGSSPAGWRSSRSFALLLAGPAPGVLGAQWAPPIVSVSPAAIRFRHFKQLELDASAAAQPDRPIATPVPATQSAGRERSTPLMRTPLLAVLCTLLSLPAAAQDKKPVETPSPAGGDTAAALNAIGLSIAKSLGPLSLTPAEVDKVLAGVRDGVSGKSSVDLDKKAQDNLRIFVQARMAMAAEKEKARGDAYLETVAKEKGAVKMPNGAIIIVLKEGTGASPGATDKVKVNYTGTLVDGKVFDSTSQHSPPAPAEFPLNGVIPCWSEALQKMKVGGRSKVVCPPAVAYGERGSPPVIPGNATLTFEVELLEIVKASPSPSAAAPAQPAK